jgi:hypothetical protein
MAKGYYQNMYEKLFGNSGLASRYYRKADNTSTASKMDKLQKQIDNKKTRIDAAGVSSDTDKRNAVEKFLGLPEDQNVIFDIFELIGRPQQAIFGAIDAAQNGEDAWEGAKKGFSGEKYTYGGEILRNAGIGDDDNGEAKLTDPSTWGADDILGLAMDLFLDPADLIPIAGFGKAADVLKGGGKVSDAIKATDSATDLLFKGAGKAAKGAAKIADTGVEKALKYSDNLKGIKYFTPDAKDAANLGKYTLNELGQRVTTNAIGKLEHYKAIKNGLSDMFVKKTKLTDNALNAIRKTDADAIRASKELENLHNGLKTKITDYAKKHLDDGADLDKAVRKLDKDLAFLKEAEHFDRKVTGKQLMKEALDGTLTREAIGDEGIKLLNKMAEPINKADRGLVLTVSVGDDGIIKLSDDWKRVEDLNLSFDDTASKTKFTKKDIYSKDDNDLLEELRLKLKDDPEFKKLVDDTDNIFNEANEIINNNFNVKLPTGEDNLGYVRHAYNKDLFRNSELTNFARNSGYLPTIGNTKVLGDRKWNATAREVNNIFKDKILSNTNLSDAAKEFANKFADGDGLFKEGLMTSLDAYMNDIPALAKNNNVLNEVLVDATFGDYKRLKDVDKQIVDARRAAHEAGIADGMSDKVRDLFKQKTEILNNSNMKILSDYDNVVPDKFTRLSGETKDNLLKKLNKINSELGTNQFKGLIDNIIKEGDKIAISDDILRLIEINVDNKSAKGISRLYDNYVNFFKKFKVFSPTFQMNNIIGNMSNMYLAGISPTTMAKLYPEASEIYLKASKLMDDAAKGVKLSVKDQKILDTWNRFMNAGFGEAGRMTASELADLPDGLKRYFQNKSTIKDVNIIDKLPYLNAKMNNDMDTVSRLVTFLNAERNPGFLKKLGVADAGAAVRKVNFDPSDLTDFEKNVMKRIMPFYTFTKKNLAFQIDNLSKNGSNYHKLLKSYDITAKSALGDAEENTPQWLKNNLYIPIPGLTKDGKYRVMRAQMPFGNLIDAVESPTNVLSSTVAPWLKAPFEIGANKNFFTGADLEKFPGEKSTNLPFLTKKQEHLLGAFSGLDVPAKSVARVLQGDNILDGLLDTVTMERSVDTDKMNKMYEELNELETMMQQYKQMGYEFSTINELKKANTNTTVNNIMSKINKLNGIKQNPYGNIK